MQAKHNPQAEFGLCFGDKNKGVRNKQLKQQ